MQSSPWKRCKLEIWARFSTQPPFSWAFIISDKIFRFQSFWSFTFKKNLGPSSSFSPIYFCFNYFRQNINALCDWNLEDQLNVALKSNSKYFRWLSRWKIFGRYLHQEGLHWEKCYFLLFFSARPNWWTHKISDFSDPTFMFFANNFANIWHIW